MDKGLRVFTVTDSEGKNGCFIEYLEEQCKLMSPIPGSLSYLLDENTWDCDNVWNRHKLTRDLMTESLVVYFGETDIPILPELKAYVFYKISERQWGVRAMRTYYNRCIFIYLSFVTKYYPDIETCTEIPYSELNLKWIHYISNHPYGVEISQQLTSFVTVMYQCLDIWIAKKNGTIWEKDIWNIDWLEEYDISRTRSSNSRQINFSLIESEPLKILLKKYTKQRLLSKVNYTWGTALTYNCVLVRFLNFIHERHPDWTNLNDLTREDILAFHNMISTHPSKDKKTYVSHRMLIIRSFLEYLQLIDFEEQPLTPLVRLILPEDIPNGGRNRVMVERYIPERVLSQIYANISNLPEDIRLIIIIMHNTGLRISDTLELTTECLEEKAGQYWIKVDVMKTKIKGHRMPITNELANMIQDRILKIKQTSDEYVNPNKFLFPSPVNVKDPVSQDNVLRLLNKFAKDYNIIDDSGEIYRFHNHAFRHTFAMSCLNNGMDILTLQELLGHASGDMTLYYAKLFDSTKREMFEKVVDSGVFSFGQDLSLEQANTSSILKEDLEDFWLAFKMNAIDTPYGICMQRSEGKCKFAKQPPCLTCNGGNPCKNLCIGVNATDSEKYKILMISAASMIAIGEKNDNELIERENKELFSLYQNIYNTISSGNIIYGRAERLKSQIKKNKEAKL